VPRSDRSPLHDVRYHAHSSPRPRRGFFISHERVAKRPPAPKLRRTTFAVPSGSANRSGVSRKGWWSQTGSNRRPPACKAGALPTELWPRTSRFVGWPANRSSRQLAPPAFAEATAGNLHSPCERRLVGLGRFELPTSRLSSARSNQLSYKPVSENGGRTTDDRHSHLSSVVCPPSPEKLVREERETETAVSCKRA
jgi:hypothetical protein